MDSKACGLIFGDCLDYINEIGMVDVVFTSPPYNRKRNDNITNYFEFSCDVINNLLQNTRKYIFWNIQTNFYNRDEIYKLIGEFSDVIIDIHVWGKTNPMPASGYSVTNSLEYFIVFGDKPLKSNNTYTKNLLLTSVNNTMPKNHKAVMKQEVADHFITNFTQKGDIILDPFMGMGTTGVSCINNGRKFIGIEKVEEYFKMAKERLM